MQTHPTYSACEIKKSEQGYEQFWGYREGYME